MSFKSEERRHQLAWKASTRTLSVEARQAGLYTKAPRGRAPERDEMFLHETRCEENLLPGVRVEALKVFKDANLDWHDGPAGGGPSNYLMDSMVSCVNCLMPFAHDGAALAALFRSLVPNAVGAMPVDDGRVLIFEWIGVGNPLRETSPKRRRSSHGTSADAFCAIRRDDGGLTGLIIEWKYTETYPEEKRKFGEPYLPFLEAEDGPIDAGRCGGPRALLVDPLYQLARLQLLAHATERARDLDCDRVIVVVLVPEGNRDYRTQVPGAELRARNPGLPLAEVWAGLLRRPDRFALTSFDDLLSTFHDDEFPAIAATVREVRARYSRGELRGS